MNPTLYRGGYYFRGLFILMPIVLGILRLFGVYAIVEENQCHVYMLFGKVIATLNEPGLHFLWAKLGPTALIINWLGRCYKLDMRLDQEYLRSQPVNSEEGAPMGIGIWYEMFISDPVAYLFKNADPRGSLAANVSNSTVRCLSNLKLDEHAGEPPCHEPDRARRGVAQIARMGLPARLGLYPQSPFPRRGDDPSRSRRKW